MINTQPKTCIHIA